MYSTGFCVSSLASAPTRPSFRDASCPGKIVVQGRANRSLAVCSQYSGLPVHTLLLLFPGFILVPVVALVPKLLDLSIFEVKFERSKDARLKLS
jgi:hypothetical protein